MHSCFRLPPITALLLVLATPALAVFETGLDDFRVSGVGTPEDPDIDANQPAVAYNPDLHEFLVVWWGDAGTADDVFEIRGQRIDADTGLPVGSNNFTISAMSNGNPIFSAFEPDVVYNTVRSEYLVVWHGDDFPNGVDNEFEVFGQRLNPDGSGIGGDFQISQVGTPGDATVGAFRAAVAHDPVSDRYLVVWSADDPESLVDEEFEIFGQFLDGNGTEISDDDFRISTMGGSGTPVFGASSATVTTLPDGDFLVAWYGDEIFNDEFEIFVQEVDARGALRGGRKEISDMGPDGTEFDGIWPALATADDGPVVAVWSGSDPLEGGVPGAVGELEIFGQLLMPEAIFSNGFESGTTMAWSSSVP